MAESVSVLKKIRLPKNPPILGIRAETMDMIIKLNIYRFNISLPSRTLVVSRPINITTV